MRKDNILFAVIGLLLGLVIGFMGANSLNRGTGTAAAPANVDPLGPMPADHPSIDGQPNTGSMPQIQETIDKARQEPDNFDAQVAAADLYYQIQRYQEALGLYTKANQLKPDDRGVIVKLGNLHYDQQQFTEAEKFYLKALEMDSEDADVRADLGLTFLLRQPPDYDRAVTEFLGALKRDPKHPQALQNLVVAYTKKGDSKAATDALSKLEGADPQNESIPRLREEIGKIGPA